MNDNRCDCECSSKWETIGQIIVLSLIVLLIILFGGEPDIHDAITTLLIK